MDQSLEVERLVPAVFGSGPRVRPALYLAGQACIWQAGTRSVSVEGTGAADRRREMNETCDRCGPAIRAAYRMVRVGELYLCGHCTSQQWPALSAQGWTIWPLGVHALAPQASAPGDYVRPLDDAA
jgi:ribosomal protein S27AE